MFAAAAATAAAAAHDPDKRNRKNGLIAHHITSRRAPTDEAAAATLPVTLALVTSTSCAPATKRACDSRIINVLLLSFFISDTDACATLTVCVRVSVPLFASKASKKSSFSLHSPLHPSLSLSLFPIPAAAASHFTLIISTFKLHSLSFLFQSPSSLIAASAAVVAAGRRSLTPVLPLHGCWRSGRSSCFFSRRRPTQTEDASSRPEDRPSDTTGVGRTFLFPSFRVSSLFSSSLSASLSRRGPRLVVPIQ